MAKRPKAKEIRKITHDALKNLLTYKVSHDVLDFLKSGAERNFREFEGAQHNTYPIKACGIRAEPGKFGKDDEYLFTEEPLAPEVTTQYLQSFPIDAVSGAYCFTILEIYGDDLVRLLNPSGAKKAHVLASRGPRRLEELR